MKAVRFHETGDVGVLRYEDVADPAPGVGEVVLRVKAAALNRLDIFLRSGAATMPGFSMPHIGGFDFAGEVAAVGAGVDASLVGKACAVNAKVVGLVARGRLDILGTARPGGFAEMAVVPADRLMDKPVGYSWEETAAFGCVYLTAYYGLVLRARVRPGDVVLVHGAGSGAGSAAIQVAKAAGATVIATAGSDEKCATAKSLLGADHVVNYRSADFAKVVKEMTGGRGADVAFDPVWGETAPKTLSCLALRGRWIVLGMVGGLHANIDVSKLMFQEIALHGIIEFYANDDEVAAAWRLAHQGAMRPIVAKAWPLAEMASAQRQMETGDFFGKIVVTP